jgi:D-3-phosphoglycerate dehydrogenase
MRILVAEQLAAEGVEILRSAHDVDERVGLSREEYLAILPEYDALMVRSQVQVDAAMFAAGTRLVVVGRAGVGVDNVDLDAATRAGVTVVNAPTGNTIAAAEHTLALLYSLARNVAAADASVRRGEWKRSQFTGVELRGKTLGLVGFGKIGQAIAARAQAMEMDVLAVDPFVTAEQAAHFGVELVDLPELLARVDVLSLHVPKNRATAGMIGAAELAAMKPTAFVLNVARGGIVEERALADALASGTIAGAGIDVYDQEPPKGSPLLEAPRTVLTPHLGASTAEAQVRVAVEAAQQVVDVLDGRPARYAVNAPLLTPETARAIAPYLPLTETLGSILEQTVRAGVDRLTVEVAGELADHDAGQLTAAALRGLLEGSTTERVNLVNATHLAKARGIEVVERRTPAAGAYASLVTLLAEAHGRRWTVAGTIANGEPRLVRIDDYRLDMAPATHMLFTSHHDRPGVVGHIGALLGAADVNISAMVLARTAPRAEAIMLLALDDTVPGDVLTRIRGEVGIIDVWVVQLGRAGAYQPDDTSE